MKRSDLVDAAVELIRRDGPAAVTSVAVAAHVGLTQSALYHHVRDVEELRNAAIQRLVEELDASLEAAVISSGVGDGPTASTEDFCRRLIHAMREHGTAFELVDRFRFAAGPLGTGVREVLDRGLDFSSCMLEQQWVAMHPDDPRPRGLRQLARLHAEFFQEDTLAAARVVRRGGALGGRRGLARSLAAPLRQRVERLRRRRVEQGPRRGLRLKSPRAAVGAEEVEPPTSCL